MAIIFGEDPENSWIDYEKNYNRNIDDENK